MAVAFTHQRRVIFCQFFLCDCILWVLAQYCGHDFSTTQALNLFMLFMFAGYFFIYTVEVKSTHGFIPRHYFITGTVVTNIVTKRDMHING